MARLNLSPLAKSLFISTSGMESQNDRILLITQNIANASTKGASPDDLYRRKLPSFKSQWNKSLGTHLLRMNRVIESPDEALKTYSPGDPRSNAEGYVFQPNISPAVEMADMREASKHYESSLRAFERVLGMIQNVSGLLK